ncbi:MAG: hypothetical protein QRY71_05375 [Candidatus Rhabdochlamydia sp.]
MNELELVLLSYHVGNFCKEFEPIWRKMILEDRGSSMRWWIIREPSLALSEIMTIAILFHLSKLWTFKDYYLKKVLLWRYFFQNL